MKKDFNDGICSNCGNAGLAGEKCLVCGDVISKIDDGLIDPVVHGDMDNFGTTSEPETYPLDVLEKEEKEDDENLWYFKTKRSGN